MINEGMSASKPIFVNMHNQIHIDEKWFYMSKTSQKYYLHPNEIEPFRTCKSKIYYKNLCFLLLWLMHSLMLLLMKNSMGKLEYGHLCLKNQPNEMDIVGTLKAKPILLVTKDVI